MQFSRSSNGPVTCRSKSGNLGRRQYWIGAVLLGQFQSPGSSIELFLGSSVKGANAEGANCSIAPQSQSTFDQPERSQDFGRRFFGRARKQLKQPCMFEKAFKCFAALAPVASPAPITQEFAGRNPARRMNALRRELAEGGTCL